MIQKQFSAEDCSVGKVDQLDWTESGQPKERIGQLKSAHLRTTKLKCLVEPQTQYQPYSVKSTICSVMARARVSSSASSSSSSASSSGSPQPQPEAETNQAPAPSAAQSDLAPEGENFGPELPSALPSDAPEPSGSDSDSAPPDNKAVIPRTSAAGHILTGGYNTYKVPQTFELL